jgi:hypothetical protein
MAPESKTFVWAIVFLALMFALSMTGLLSAHGASAPILPSREDLEGARQRWLSPESLPPSVLPGCSEKQPSCACNNPCSISIPEASGFGGYFKSRELKFGVLRHTHVHVEPAGAPGKQFDVQLEAGDQARLAVPREGARLAIDCSPEILCTLQLSQAVD